MEMIIINKSAVPAALTRAQKAYSVLAPVRTENGYIIKTLEEGKMPDLDGGYPVLSAKSAVFPQNDVLLTFAKNKDEACSMTAPEFDAQPKAIFGIRPYDAKAIEMLKLNFATPDTQDPYFSNRVENLTLIGLAQTRPDSCDFSNSCGTGPFDETSLDLILADAGDSYVGKVLTEKGKKFAMAADFPKGDDKAAQTFEALKAEAEGRMADPVDLSWIADVDTMTLYDAPVWEDLSFGCINCNTCTYVCPTCWCFDIQDEKQGEDGIRFKMWDSCMCDLYTAHASGHNPREKGEQRFRNRFMHKLKYFHDKYEAGIMCVGCGRCIRSCPAGIDIRTIIRTLNSVEAVH